MLAQIFWFRHLDTLLIVNCVVQTGYKKHADLQIQTGARVFYAVVSADAAIIKVERDLTAIAKWGDFCLSIWLLIKGYTCIFEE